MVDWQRVATAQKNDIDTPSLIDLIDRFGINSGSSPGYSSQVGDWRWTDETCSHPFILIRHKSA